MNSFRFLVGVNALIVAPLTLLCCATVRKPPIQVVRWLDGVNVVQNPSFDDRNSLVVNDKGFVLLPAGPACTTGPNCGSTALPCWQVVGVAPSPAQGVPGQAVGWIVNQNKLLPNGGAITTPTGNAFLNLSGNHQIDDNVLFVGVQQTLRTIAGQPYALSFSLGMDKPDFPGPVQAVAKLFNGTPLLGMQPLSPQAHCSFDTPIGGSQWTPAGTCHLDPPGFFVAKSDNTTLLIQGIPAPGTLPGAGSASPPLIGLDAIDVECMAPLGNHAQCQPIIPPPVCPGR
jgi:hypothetical protein